MEPRIRAFEQCILNTCVRLAQGYYEGLTSDNCLDAPDFAEAALGFLQQPLFNPIEPVMATAKVRMIRQLEVKLAA